MPRRLGTQACWGQLRCPCQMLSCSQMLAPETCGCHFRCVCNHQTQPALLQTCSDYSNHCKSILHTTHYYQQPICAHQPFSCGPAPQISTKWQCSCNAIVHHQCVSKLAQSCDAQNLQSPVCAEPCQRQSERGARGCAPLHKHSVSFAASLFILSDMAEL